MLKYAFKNAFEKERCQVSYGNLIRWYKSSMILSTKWMPLQVNICQKHLFLNQLSTIWRQIVHWITSSAHENSKFRTCWEHAVYIKCSECQNKSKKKPIWVTCSQPWNFHVLNLFNEQSFVILWVSWYKNKCFWKRFTCKGNKKVFCELSYVAPWIKVNLIQKACTKCFAGSPIKI